MKCIECNCDTRVLETRGTKRRRLCPNDHVFWTDELIISDVTVHGERAMRATALRDAVARRAKDKPIVIAHELGIPLDTVETVRHRLKGTSDGSAPQEAT